MDRNIIKDKWWLKLENILHKILHPAGAPAKQDLPTFMEAVAYMARVGCP